MSPSRHDTCRVCRSASEFAFTQQLLGRPVDYFDCSQCGYLQTQTPDWLDRAYARAINDVDTGIMQRNQFNVGRVLGTLAAYGRIHGRVVDHAGGYGILVRMLRDVGVDARWRDKYCTNLLARGFEAGEEPYDLLTCFEVFEHLLNPVDELRTMLVSAPVVLVSTELVPESEKSLPDWWYLGPEHGQHIGFFRPLTLRRMAEMAGCHHASDGRSVHVFSRSPVPRIWQTCFKWTRWWKLVARFQLRSRTVSDFESLRNRQT